MAKLLRVRDRILIGLSLMHDILGEVRSAGGIVSSSYKSVYGFTPEKYKKANLYSTVHRMLSADLIDRVIVDGEPKFRLTSIGTKRMVREFPLYYLQNKAWDKKWRIVLFDIPEKERWKRDNLRAKLKELGFGMIQMSVWMSPHPFEDDVRAFLKAKGLENYAYVFISASNYLGDVEILIDKAWNLEELNESYEKLVFDYQKGEGGRESMFVDNFFKLFTSDPYLPRELLPDPWYGDEAREIVKKISKG